MKQLVILSGKGGTGKTSITAALADLASQNSTKEKMVIVDADVDAANLELLLQPTIIETNQFMGSKVAIIDQALCLKCGSCQILCRYGAIYKHETIFEVDPIACEGCASCVHQCPNEAIKMAEQIAGKWHRSKSIYGPLFHAALYPAQDNSGKLISKLKQEAIILAKEKNFNTLLVDGPPGIGCPVISSVSGADLALIVVEPSAAGVHDMERVLNTVKHFNIPALVCINKADLLPKGANTIRNFCMKNGIEIIGIIPFDKAVTEAMVQGQTITSYKPEGQTSVAIRDIWRKISKKLH